jgi:hypothetical protein
MTTPKPTIVVGYDGSPASETAAFWVAHHPAEDTSHLA